MGQADGIRYDAYVARRYDTYVSTALDVPFFLNEAKEASGGVLELMSGTGRVSIPLIEAGVRLTCVDNSPEMLNVLRSKLRKRGLSASVCQMDVRHLDLEKQFELVLIPFCSFSELVSQSDQLKTLASIHDHLTRDGRFICTLHNPVVRLKRVDGLLRLRRKCELEDDGKLLVWGQQTLDQAGCIARGVQFFEEYDASGIMRRRTLLEVQYCLLNGDEFSKLARSVGFKVANLYGDYSYSNYQKDVSPSMVWVLEKASAVASTACPHGKSAF
jgi:SAM-dependent methyltransferase